MLEKTFGQEILSVIQCIKARFSFRPEKFYWNTFFLWLFKQLYMFVSLSNQESTACKQDPQAYFTRLLVSSLHKNRIQISDNIKFHQQYPVELHNCSLPDLLLICYHCSYHTLREKCPYSEFFWSAFPGIRTEYGEILHISPYSVRIRENMDKKNSEYGNFSRILYLLLTYSEAYLIPSERLRWSFWQK